MAMSGHCPPYWARPVCAGAAIFLAGTEIHLERRPEYDIAYLKTCACIKAKRTRGICEVTH
jgi:hypothetical protein